MAEALTYKSVLKLALPASVASMVTPLLGLVDAAVLGQTSRPLDVGAVGLAAAIFSLAYWTFGFLRMSTAGLAAQAIGAEDEKQARQILVQSISIGAFVGIILVLLQYPFGAVSFAVMTADATLAPETVAAAKTYYAIRIWGAPFVLMTYGLLGWLTARGRTDLLMAVSVGMTLLNIILDVLFVLYFDYGAAGVAAGTLIAEIAGAMMAGGAIFLILNKSGGVSAHWGNINFFARSALVRLFAVNVDIFIRTFVLVLAFVFFTQRGALFGDVTLSANQLLMQFFLVTGLALDGSAIAAESLVGQALGRRDLEKRAGDFKRAANMTSVVAAIMALTLTLFYVIFGQWLLDMVAPDAILNAAARDYFWWIIISPLVVATCFQLDGIYIGATRSKALRNSMIVSGLAYLAAVFTLMPLYGNHGLWAAFTIFMLARAITLGMAWQGFYKMWAPPSKV